MGITHNIIHKTRERFNRLSMAIVVFVALAIPCAAQQAALQLDPAETTVRFTLDAALHTVHGTFQTKEGSLQFDPVSGQLSGQILVDAKSGQTGNGMRDRKMNKDVLESEQYPEISFRPRRIEGTVASQGKSSVVVHGMFSIHGADHEITVPFQVEMGADHWSATAQFTVPYEKWGMKNPSTLFLRVSDSVEIELATAGSVMRHTAEASH